LSRKKTILTFIKQARDHMITRTHQHIAHKQQQIDYLIISLGFTTFICLLVIIAIVWFRTFSLKKWLG